MKTHGARAQTQPCFIIGSGRSGTRALYKALLGNPSLEVHHEFACEVVQRAACEYSMGLASSQDTERALEDTYGSAIFWSNAQTWIDCSNKATWLIAPIAQLFPTARFLNVVRDGRKVALSFFKKLGHEMYDDEAVTTMQTWLADRSLPRPPLEKRYWWNIPQEGQPFFEEFSNFNQFERACYHWVEANRVARSSLLEIPAERSLTVNLESLVRSTELQRDVMAFLGVDFSPRITDALRKPQNVIVPVDFVLNQEQRTQFERIASDEMRQLGYDMSQPEERIVY